MLASLLSHEKLQRLLAALRTHRRATASGLWGAACGLVTAAVAAQSEWDGPVLVVAAGPEQADAIEDDLTVFSRRSILPFPAWDVLPTETDTPEMDVVSARVAVLRRLLDLKTGGAQSANSSGADFAAGDEEADANAGTDEHPMLALPDAAARLAITCSVQAVLQPVPSRQALEAGEWVLRAGDDIPLLRLQRWLFDHGFERVPTVETRGQFGFRGGILDVFPLVAEDGPYRLEFFGERVESIRRFDPYSQRSTGNAPSVRLVGLDDQGLIEPFTLGDPASLAEFLPPSTLLVVPEPEQVAERAASYCQSIGSNANLFSWDDLLQRLAGFARLDLTTQRDPDPPAEASAQTDGLVAFDVTSVQRFDGGLETARRELRHARQSTRVTIFCLNESERSRLETILTDGDLPPDARLQLKLGHLSAGFDFRDLGQICLTDHELFHRYSQRRRTKRPTHAATPIDHFLDLSPGDFVVHQAHGVARYLGLSRLKIDHQESDYLTLLFADDVKVYLPAAHVRLIGKYVGVGGARPRLSKVGGKAWVRKKERACQAIRDIATDLLAIQARRAARPGIAFPPDGEWQRQFEASFIYEETPDQLAAVDAIKADIERPVPMDRLLCGDVGFGKTEVAVRVAFKVVTAGRQVAILVPTTILAEQHGKTFRERFAGYPIVVEVLSRFRPGKEQDEVIKSLESGTVDVVIGTHRLLSSDVRFRNLGLVIIDEEQRFGVEHKEVLKAHRAAVDVLTLTATPLPRTLHMAMLGLRDISSLSVPPADRLAIRTKVCRFAKDLIRRAMLRELNRGGQVYFVHNRVADIHRIADELRALVPEARIVVGHGQMPARELDAVMRTFIHHGADVLVSTTIIESGVDIPNTNTIFINNANRFGLAELHQLRGRVGRYKHRAYAYLMIPAEGAISETSRKRLKALEEFDELGAGFRLALRDLEIRGAGNLLGAEQSGHIAEIGYDLYCKLLDSTVKELKGEPVDEKARFEVTLHLGAGSFVPPEYIPDEKLRLDLYRRLGEARADVASSIGAELADRYGPVPEPVRRLLAEAELRALAGAAGVPYVGIEGNRLKMKLHGWRRERLEEKLNHLDDVRVLTEQELTFPLPQCRDHPEMVAYAGKLLKTLATD